MSVWEDPSQLPVRLLYANWELTKFFQNKNSLFCIILSVIFRASPLRLNFDRNSWVASEPGIFHRNREKRLFYSYSLRSLWGMLVYKLSRNCCSTKFMTNFRIVRSIHRLGPMDTVHWTSVNKRQPSSNVSASLFRPWTNYPSIRERSGSISSRIRGVRC